VLFFFVTLGHELLIMVLLQFFIKLLQWHNY